MITVKVFCNDHFIMNILCDEILRLDKDLVGEDFYSIDMKGECVTTCNPKQLEKISDEVYFLKLKTVG